MLRFSLRAGACLLQIYLNASISLLDWSIFTCLIGRLDDLAIGYDGGLE
jgi:hypothetical protein